MCKYLHIKPIKVTMIIFVALMLFAQPAMAQDTITMPANGSRTDTLHAGSSYTLLDPGGTDNYPNSCNSTLRVVSDSGTAIMISGLVRTEYNQDFLLIYEGLNSNGRMRACCSGLQNVSVTALTGAVTLVFNSSPLITHNGFALSVSVCDISSLAITNINIDTITTNSATLTWGNNSAVTGWTIHYGTTPDSLNSTMTTFSNTATLTGLAANSTYYYYVSPNQDSSNPCNIRIHQMHTTCNEERSSCIDYDNLTTCYVKGTYGTFMNPLQNQGFIDYGSDSHLSRQTVHTDTSETDPRTNGLLHTVPPGYSSSVRLGNWNVGGESESITYEYHVDTTARDLLLLKYAAVLQVPNHSAAEQPRFSFMILDEDGNEINSSCYSANFIASTSLGWNVSTIVGDDGNNNSYTLWKDWTTVGIDLTPLHGETIYIRLLTSDCSHERHYGYAYFLFDCTNKTMRAERCGSMVENTFTAPEGFDYHWYKVTEPDSIIGTSQSLHVTQGGEYRCRLMFIDAPAGTNCSFELSAFADVTFPAAIMSWDSVSRAGCDLEVILHNNSVIGRDESHSRLTGLPCDEVEWIVDNVSYSTENSPTVVLTPGLHSVQLVAKINNGSCTDTTEESILVSNPCYRSDTVVVAICEGDTAWLFEIPYNSSGIYEGDSGYHHRTMILNVLQTYDDTVALTIVENDLPYSYAGNTFYNPVNDSIIVFNSMQGCDSIIYFSMFVNPNKHSFLDSTVCENELPLDWNDITFLSDSIASQTFEEEAVSGADSTVTMTVHVKRNSTFSQNDTVVENQLPVVFGGRTFTGMIQDSSFIIQNHLGCDSMLNYSLYVWYNVHSEVDSSICENQLPLTWNGVTFNGEDSIESNLASIGIYASHGEDSIVTMRLIVRNNTASTVYDTAVENQLPVTFIYSDFTEPVDTFFIIHNYEGCDSTIHYSLHVWYNSHTELDSTICADQLPLDWEGHRFMVPQDSLSQWNRLVYNYHFSIFDSHGADSTVTLTLYIMPVYDLVDTVVICEGETTPQGFSETGDQELRLNSTDNCDSIVHLTIIVHPVYQYHINDTICDNQSTLFNGTEVNNAGTHEAVLQSVHGCDSIITLNLTVFNTYNHYDRAVVCDGVPYRWIDGNTYNNSTYQPQITYSDIHGCDSVLHLLLDLDDNFKATIEIAPEIVDMDHPEVRLYDHSKSYTRDWYITDISSITSHHDTSRLATFRFPLDKDSLQVLLVARTMAGCIDSVWGMVRCDKAVFWAPNAFTPDEAVNNRFQIVTNQLATGEVWVYDRQGLLVTTFDAIEGSWDGTYHGKNCPQSTYTWIMQYSTLAQPRQKRTDKGSVTLLR